MPTEIHAILAHADVPNINGRVYPKAVLEKVVAEARALDAKPIAVTTEQGDEPPTLAELAGQAVDFRVEDGKLIATIRLIDSPIGATLQKLLGLGLGITNQMFRTDGVGTVANGVVQMDYTLTGITLDIEALAKDKRLRNVLIKKMKAAYDAHRIAKDPGKPAQPV